MGTKTKTCITCCIRHLVEHYVSPTTNVCNPCKNAQSARRRHRNRDAFKVLNDRYVVEFFSKPYANKCGVWRIIMSGCSLPHVMAAAKNMKPLGSHIQVVDVFNHTVSYHARIK